MGCRIDMGAAFTCPPEQSGIGDYLYLINFEDWAEAQVVTYDTGVTEEITAFTLKVGGQGYKYEAPKGSMHIIPSSPFRGATAKDGTDHTLDIRAQDVSQLSRENIVKMMYQKVVGIVPLQNGKYMIYGQKNGLRISDYQENPGDADIGGTIQFVLKTPDNDPPSVAPPHIISSTYDITELDTPAI